MGPEETATRAVIEINWIALPAAILALIGILGIFLKLGRRDRKLDEHSETLEELRKMDLMTFQDCLKTQETCRSIQERANAQLAVGLQKVADQLESNRIAFENELRMDRTELFREMKADRESVQKEMKQLNLSMGQLQGILQKTTEERR